MRPRRAILPLCGLYLAAAASCSGPAKPGQTADIAAQRASRGDSYYLSTCALCDRPLGHVRPAIDTMVGDRSLRFCGSECESKFRADPGVGTAHIDAVMTRDQGPHYPLATSVVSGKPLGTAPVDVVWCNRLVRLAEAPEQTVFLREPDRFVGLLDAEVIRAQSPTYGMPTRCPVQGDILASDTPIDFVVANRMVRVCCPRCVRVVKNRPYQFLALVDFANKEASAARGE